MMRNLVAVIEEDIVDAAAMAEFVVAAAVATECCCSCAFQEAVAFDDVKNFVK